jgi:hypothetical protein
MCLCYNVTDQRRPQLGRRKKRCHLGWLEKLAAGAPMCLPQTGSEDSYYTENYECLPFIILYKMQCTRVDHSFVIHIQYWALLWRLYNYEHQQTCVRVACSLVDLEISKKPNITAKISESQDVAFRQRAWPPAPSKLKLKEIKMYNTLLDHWLVTFGRVAQKPAQKELPSCHWMELN